AKILRISNQAGASKAPNVLVTDKDVDLSQLREKIQVIQSIGDGAMPRDQLKQQVANVDALYCLVRDQINKEVLDAAKKLKVVSTMSVGFDHIDIQECKKMDRHNKWENEPDELCSICLFASCLRRRFAISAFKSISVENRSLLIVISLINQ
uniref:D-isomer specific 2-hydroxyacid dehydrogenase catalytic domain-containing protein n=1 Tax=Parascaris univalens TaxID=6257 RepID=A0A915BUS0_PARUN